MLSADDVLELWERAHGVLPPARRTAFLAREEVRELCSHPAAAVAAAIAESPALAVIAARVRGTSWWFRGEACEPDEAAYCARCRPYPYPSVVVVTEGSSEAFHATESCAWLVKGQRRVRERGGEPARLVRVALQVALGRGRQPCLACFPPPGS